MCTLEKKISGVGVCVLVCVWVGACVGVSVGACKKTLAPAFAGALPSPPKNPPPGFAGTSLVCYYTFLTPKKKQSCISTDFLLVITKKISSYFSFKKIFENIIL